MGIKLKWLKQKSHFLYKRVLTREACVFENVPIIDNQGCFAAVDYCFWYSGQLASESLKVFLFLIGC